MKIVITSSDTPEDVDRKMAPLGASRAFGLCTCSNQLQPHDRMRVCPSEHDGQHDLETCADCRVAVGMAEDQD